MAPAIILGLNYLGIDYTDPIVILGSRVLYGLAQAFMLALAGYIYLQAAKRNDTTKLKVKKQPGAFAAAQAAAAARDGQPAATADEEEVTVRQYDQEQAISLVKQTLMQAAIVSFIHFKWGMIPPLILSFAMLPMTLSGSPLFHIYVLGRKAEGAYARPFKADNSGDLFGLQKKMQEMQSAQAGAATTEEQTKSIKEVKKEAKRKLAEQKQ
eukprot:TRINITY_DN3749_c0_g1_i1.p1 TRINITY_DN3749_c0_g1~~TRINITY_DN3749_c0_g1_i1.p1  ORF type:complete len:231 (+),score=60.78 TRINITY_DN3749_c0_g1_i1:61-693(+)